MLWRRFFIALISLTLLVVTFTIWKWNDVMGQYVSSPHGRKDVSYGKYILNHLHAHHNDARFFLKHTFKLPAPKYTKQHALQSGWVEDLKRLLKTLSTTRLSIVTASQEHKVVVINWLISALVKVQPPLENVLVLAVSSSLYEYLKSKDIPVIYVDPLSLISSQAVETFDSVFSQIHVVRLTFFRLINHWGYDVVMYDSDAVLLRNIQPLFDMYPGADLIGSAGIGPEKLSSLWGRTLCTGVLLLRATAKTEHFWSTMSTIGSHLTDQGLVNEALFKMNIEWNMTEAKDKTSAMHGISPRYKLQSVILSEEVICRYTCDMAKKDQYFAWHKPAINKERTIKNKINRALDGEVWYLIDGWNSATDLTGVRWLHSVTRKVDQL